MKKINMDWVTGKQELNEWMNVKNDALPAIACSDNWRTYVGFLEKKLNEFGVVDMERNSWQHPYWHTSENPADWSLRYDGKQVDVAFYGAYSGTTGPDGMEKEMILVDPLNPPADMKDKIVVIPTMPHPKPPYNPEDYVEDFIPSELFGPYTRGYIENYTYTDYDYRLDEETFPEIMKEVPASETVQFDTWWQTLQALHYVALGGGAAGLVIVYDMCMERTRGHYAFPLQDAYDCPTLLLDRVEGAKLIADLAEGPKKARFTLNATTEPSELYQVVGYLPGKDYGTESDEQIILTSHSDGPSVTQDNGPLGLLSVVQYYSNIPREEREKTFMVYIDCRHYIPGHEWGCYQNDYFYRNPGKLGPVVSTIHIEHLGAREIAEKDGELVITGRTDPSYLWTRNETDLVAEAKEAMDTYHPDRVMLMVPERPGKNGGVQTKWWGVNVVGAGEKYQEDERMLSKDIPGFGFAGLGSTMYNVFNDIRMWDVDAHQKQLCMMLQLTEHLYRNR